MATLNRLFIKLALGGAALLPLTSCNGIFDDIYDEAPSVVKSEYGFVEVDEANNSGRIFINATAYERWMYIDLHHQKVDSLMITGDMDESQNWDFAVHRYDTKTNGGSVVETTFDSLEEFRKDGASAGDFVADIWTDDRIAIDMTHMMEGNIIYAESNYNEELSKWMNVSTATMPPTYTPSNKVYILRMNDGTRAALRLSGFTDDIGTKGWLTIDYIYPLNK